MELNSKIAQELRLSLAEIKQLVEDKINDERCGEFPVKVIAAVYGLDDSLIFTLQ